MPRNPRRPLPDYLRPGLKLLFVGINPGLISAKAGHYYANPRNPFWRLLHEAGLTPVLLRPDEDSRMPSFGYGLTDIVKRPSRGAGDLKSEEFVTNRRRLLRLVRRFRPKAVCFNSKTAFEGYFGKPRTTDLRPWLWSRTTSRPVAANRIQGKKVVRDWGAALRGSSEHSPRTRGVVSEARLVRGSFPHSRARRSVVRGKGACRRLGPQSVTLANTPVFVLPSTSPANAAVPLTVKRRYFRKLKAWLEQLGLNHIEPKIRTASVSLDIT